MLYGTIRTYEHVLALNSFRDGNMYGCQSAGHEACMIDRYVLPWVLEIITPFRP